MQSLLAWFTLGPVKGSANASPVGIVGPVIERAQPGGQVHLPVCFSSQRQGHAG